MKPNPENLDFGTLLRNSLSGLFADLLNFSVKETTKDSKTENPQANEKPTTVNNIHIRIVIHPPKKSWWEKAKEMVREKFKKFRHAKIRA